MKNLLTKTLFISLLLSVAISSGIQANFPLNTAKNLGKLKRAAMIRGLTKAVAMGQEITAAVKEALTVRYGTKSLSFSTWICAQK